MDEELRKLLQPIVNAVDRCLYYESPHKDSPLFAEADDGTLYELLAKSEEITGNEQPTERLTLDHLHQIRNYVKER